MSEEQKIPKTVLDAYDLLLQHRIVEIIKPLDWNTTKGDGKGWVFECNVTVTYPNRENIPVEVPLCVVISEGFPYTPVEFYPKCKELICFPHQEAATRKLCLPEERLAPRDINRLVHYVKWAQEWLEDAVSGNLLKPGDPFELPDFSRKILTEPLPIDYPICFNEDEKSYKKWGRNIGSTGIVECFIGKYIPAIFALRFYSEDKILILQTEFASSIYDQNKLLSGKWLILSDIRYKRHCPPQTYKEIQELCSSSGIDFYELLYHSWALGKNSLGIGLILVGFPIPKTYGENDVEIHWQPLIFPDLRSDLKQSNLKKKSNKRNKIWNRLINYGRFEISQQLPWGKAVNITRDRMYARGSYSPAIKSKRIAIFGCGALGSIIAELLARGGVNTLTLFDQETLQFGNLCRHTLRGEYIGHNKALALGSELSYANPLSNITGYATKIPLSSSSPPGSEEAISDADAFIDCTANESVFEWLNNYAIDKNKQMVLVFFDFYAEILTLCISGRQISCGEIFQDLLFHARNEQLPITSQQYLYQPTKEEQIIEGAGCWHPTFPALYAHICMLAAAALDILNTHIEQGEGKGRAVIIRRNSIAEKEIQPSSLTEIIWMKEYL